MESAEPPRLARWLLEHCSAPGRDEALAGDLLEELRAGRSPEWYRRQALNAVTVSWMRVLGARGMLFLFAVLWSSLAPAWKVFTDHLQDQPVFTEIWSKFGSIWILPAFALWVALHSAFLWIGILIYLVCIGALRNSFRDNFVRHASSVATVIFLPVAGMMFILMNLYSFPGLINERLASTPLAQILDWRMPADVLRIPYFIALICALWQATPRFAFTLSEALATMRIDEAVTNDSPSMFTTGNNDRSPARFVRFLVLAGLVNALIVAVLLCRLPATHEPSLTGMLVRAAAYVGLGALAGTLGAWAYWHRATSSGARLPLPFGLFALVCAVGWVWVPAVVLLAAQDAPAAAGIAALGAALFAVGLRRVLPLFHDASADADDHELFAAALRTPPRELQGYVIAGCIYLAGFALNNREHLVASGLLALSAFIFVWQLTLAPSRVFSGVTGSARAARRLARIAIPAVLITLWALLDGVAHRDRVGDGDSDTASAHGNTAGGPVDAKQNPADLAAALDGYESIVLWPEPPKKEILAPVPLAPQLHDPRLNKPLVLRFNGAYWYFQPPSDHPGPHAHVTHGSPLAVDIHSTSFVPLTMEAHQTLALPLRVACCGSISVEIENRDNRPGPLALAMTLTDNAAPGHPSLYLGLQPVASSQPGQFRIKTGAVTETLRFALPAHAPLKKFDEISLVVISDTLRIDMGARIAIAQFELMPR